MVDFPIRASIYRGFSIATFDYHRVVVPICKHDIGIYWVHPCKVMQSQVYDMVTMVIENLKSRMKMALSENGGTPKISKHPLVHHRKIPIETA